MGDRGDEIVLLPTGGAELLDVRLLPLQQVVQLRVLTLDVARRSHGDRQQRGVEGEVALVDP